MQQVICRGLFRVFEDRIEFLMEREKHDNGNFYYLNHHHHHHQEVDRVSPDRMISSSSSSSSLLARPSTPPMPPSSCSPVGGLSYIEHRVSKMDTLAGVAIKYGVEVADIKRLNGLVTDLQMFALKTLNIPLPGRHPPSPILSNGLDSQGPSSFEETPPRRRQSDLFDSFESLKLKSSPQRRVSPAMSNLQGYYGLKPADQRRASEGFEMVVYRKGSSHYLEDGPFNKPSPLSNPPLRHHRKCKSVANGFFSENDELADGFTITEAREVDSDKWNEKLFRRRQKSEADFSVHNQTPEKLLKDDNSSSGGFSAITGKGLALRPKAANRTAAGVEAEPGFLNRIPIALADSLVADGFNSVRKSSSTSSLHEQENSTSSLLVWPTSKWNLKPDLQALSTAAVTGLPKPTTGRKNKAALD
ncbi:hypothetical protein CsSME_00042721 [Camellia sinensis var. sinensis]